VGLLRGFDILPDEFWTNFIGHVLELQLGMEKDPAQKRFVSSSVCMLLLMEEIPNNHLQSTKPL